MRRLLVLLALPLFVAGCTVPRVVLIADPVGAARMEADLAGHGVGVRLQDGSRVDAELISVGADTCVFRDRESGAQRSIPTVSVESVEAWKPMKGAAAGAAVGAAVTCCIVLPTAAGNPFSGAALLVALPVGAGIGALSGVVRSWRVYRFESSLTSEEESTGQAEADSPDGSWGEGLATPPDQRMQQTSSSVRRLQARLRRWQPPRLPETRG
jgi:hypothetical protein